MGAGLFVIIALLSTCKVARCMSTTALLPLLADGQFHSGQDLADTLGISRTAVWKQLRKLDELGLHAETVKGRGYRIAGGIELLDGALIRAALRPSAAARLGQLLPVESVDSTNAEVLRQLQQGAGSGLVCAAERQSTGRGRRGRQWVSPYGANLYLSLAWEYAQGAAVLEGLSLAVGVAVARALAACDVPPVQLKWPNDIQVHGRKLGGILVELASARQVAAVVGIGLNLSLPDDASIPGRRDVTALDQVIDDLPSREAFLAELLRVQRSLFETYANSGFAAFQGAWNQRNAYAELPVRLIGETDSLEGICLGVDIDGALRLQTDAGVRRVLAGDVSLRAAG